MSNVLYQDVKCTVKFFSRVPSIRPLGDKVGILTHIYTHTKPGGRLKWSYAKSPGWQPTLCVAWCLICWFALAYKKYGHTWHRMSLLRPGVIKQHKPNQTKPIYPTGQLVKLSNHQLIWDFGHKATMIPPFLEKFQIALRRSKIAQDLSCI